MPVRNAKPFYFVLLLAIGAYRLLTGSPAFCQQAATGSAQNAPAATATPQPAVSAAQNQPFTFKTSVTEVVLYATVVDSHQRLVTSLQKQDFTIYENNVPQTISSCSQEDVPVSMAILIDNSGSMAQKRAAVNRAAIDLIQASNPQDEAFIVNFSDEAFLDQDFTSNINLLRKGLSHIDSEGGTALYDAVIAAADHLAKQAKHPKQVILIITDGEDNSSSATLADTVRRIQDLNGPIVYSIGLLYDESDRSQSHRARKALQTLSDETGGIAFFPKSLDQVDTIAAEVAQDIRHQYVLGYHPTDPISRGGYRTVRVEAKAKGLGKLSVRTRAGYFANPHPSLGATSSTPAHP
ncbi:MAG TPA: VWA domain-containing protein [Acidobacteriaceae bacterium]|nr:VWA domain-containing protein [Acidobacteriaceae bacterium]